jgi:hypothetical protein
MEGQTSPCSCGGGGIILNLDLVKDLTNMGIVGDFLAEVSQVPGVYVRM